MANYYLKHTGAELDAAIDTANAALPKSGGTMEGALILNGNPSSDNAAANKKYVDEASAAKAYADSKAETTFADTKSYADNAVNAALDTAKEFASSEAGATLVEANKFASERAEEALVEAKSYADNSKPTALKNPHALTFNGAVTGTYDGSEPLEITIPEGGGGSNVLVEQETPLFASGIEECTDTSKVYVMPDGYIYAYMYSQSGIPEITIEGKAGGYYVGDEWNPTGKLQTAGSCSAKRTDVIPVTPGDVLKYKGYGAEAVYSVFWLDSTKATLLSREQLNSTGSYTNVTAPENAAYVWFGSFAYAANASEVVLDVQWVNCQAASTTYQWTNTGHAFVPADYEDRIIELERKTNSIESSVIDSLNGKKIGYDGDSICMGYMANGGYPALIASLTGGIFDNQAIGGARLCAHDTQHSVVNNLSKLPLDGDIYCFQGGINDYWANASLGTCTPGDYTGALDTSTICGALETIFRYALTNFTGKAVCFIITHKIQNTAYTANTAGHTFKDYRDAMAQVCEKYSIPYYDAFSKSGLNGWNDAQNNAFLTANGAGIPDGTHPNKEGYIRYYVPQLLDLFRSFFTGIVGVSGGDSSNGSFVIAVNDAMLEGEDTFIYPGSYDDFAGVLYYGGNVWVDTSGTSAFNYGNTTRFLVNMWAYEEGSLVLACAAGGTAIFVVCASGTLTPPTIA